MQEPWGVGRYERSTVFGDVVAAHPAKPAALLLTVGDEEVRGTEALLQLLARTRSVVLPLSELKHDIHRIQGAAAAVSKVTTNWHPGEPHHHKAT